MFADALVTSCTDDQGADEAIWLSCVGQMKPGASGFIHIRSSSAHKTGLALRRVGFERRDTLTLFSVKGISLVLFIRKPLVESSVVTQVLATGTGVININACRIDGHVPSPTRTRQYRRFDNKYNDLDSKGKGPILELPPEREDGRWPPNMVFQHLPACQTKTIVDHGRRVRVVQCDSGCFVEALESQSAERGVQGTRLKDGHAQDGAAARFFPQFSDVAEFFAWLRRLAAQDEGVIIDPFNDTPIATPMVGWT